MVMLSKCEVCAKKSGVKGLARNFVKYVETLVEERMEWKIRGKAGRK